MSCFLLELLDRVSQLTGTVICLFRMTARDISVYTSLVYNSLFPLILLLSLLFIFQLSIFIVAK